MAAGAANVEDVGDGRAVDSLGTLLRVVEEWIWRHASTTALEGDIRVETLKGVRAVVNTTHPLTMTASSHRVLVREDSVAACFDLRAHALIRMRGGRTTSVAKHSAHAIAHRVRRWTDALFPLCDERRFAVERARVLGCASGRRVIRIYATLPVHGIVDQ